MMNRESERKRLVELLIEYETRRRMRCGIEECADHLLDNGVIVPPVKVGQTVYYITGIHGKIVKDAKIVEIYYNGDGYAYRVNSEYLNFDMQADEIFTSREDAEKALKGDAGV